ncbi:AAA family ATPase [Flavobacterium sp. MMLR14_040]|uniref:AAA family ATPase n=1 Tax=Flavobacterium sp. MMLR14_040 TaxID=3093843 RepID=UPI002990549B|nr:AAA family ATPase [Flavobacterium sp. MMLR14_040]MDW8852896.1 AAA family ATPase [Flavobacterium sp. MMLR14_040]
MKIKKLWVSKYKNLENQWFNFKDGPLISLLVGQNGLGKSNLLEVITSIMRQIDLAENEEQLTIKTDRYFFDFEITYISEGNEIELIAKNESLTIHITEPEKAKANISFNTFKINKSKGYFPENIIVYYSGENKRIKKLFERHKEKRDYNLKRIPKLSESPVLGRLFYVEENYGEILFFVLWIIKELPDYKNHIGELFSEFSGIEKESSVYITLCNPTFYTYKKQSGVEDLESNGYNYEPLWNLNGEVEQFVRILYDNQIVKAAPTMYRDPDEVKEKKIDEFIIFDKLDFDELAVTLLENFGSVLKIFDVLEAAHSIGIIYKIGSSLNKNGSSIQHDFSELSEGEQQLLTVMGLLLITGRSNTLYLLDEPDTHLNPQWQRDYAYLLKKFDVPNENSQIIVSTHSPLIVQSAEESDLFLFKKKNGSVVVDKNEHKIHNWRLDQVLVSEYFGLDSARPRSLDNYMKLKEEILNKYPFEKEDEIRLAEFENDFGVLPTGETKTEIKVMQLMNHFIKNQDDTNKK